MVNPLHDHVALQPVGMPWNTLFGSPHPFNPCRHNRSSFSFIHFCLHTALDVLYV